MMRDTTCPSEHRLRPGRMRLTLASLSAIGLLGAPGCDRFMPLPAQTPKAIEYIPAPVIAEPDRVPALEAEIKRLTTRIAEQGRVRSRIAIASARLDRLFRADNVSVARKDVVTALDAGLPSVEGVDLVEVNGVDNRWTVLARIDASPPEEAWRLATLFAEQVSLLLPNSPPIDLARHFEGGPHEYVLGFLHPRSLRSDRDATRVPAPGDIAVEPGGPAEPEPPAFDSAPLPEEPPGANMPVPAAPGTALPLAAPEAPVDAPLRGPEPEALPTAAPSGFPVDPVNEEAVPTAAPAPTDFGTLRNTEPVSRRSAELLVPVEPFVGPEDDGLHVTPSADPNKSERERVLEGEIARLEDRLDERALIAERQALSAIERDLAAIETKRLPATRDREFRVAGADLRTVAEQAQLRNIAIVDHGPYRYLGLPARWYTVDADGGLPAAGEAVAVFDAAGGLVGETKITRNPDDSVHLMAYVFVLSR